MFYVHLFLNQSLDNKRYNLPAAEFNSERMRARVSSQILNRGSGCENGGENDGDNSGEITGGENDGLERIDGNLLRNRL
ncbi:hypothetical protein DY000_02049335 [Brassica cretica]|uniref:Uncharacterized protein n=1 Tax=Brassica cretica TaxID=69181 RepID=A0ABQ7EW48_BRACR|nr:hypothetical protein DY000_02049335 [Brassica cretica]